MSFPGYGEFIISRRTDYKTRHDNLSVIGACKSAPEALTEQEIKDLIEYVPAHLRPSGIENWDTIGIQRWVLDFTLRENVIAELWRDIEEEFQRSHENDN